MRRRTKKVNQYTLDGKYIKTFSSMSDANFEMSGNKTGPIFNAIKGLSPSMYGYVWKYYNV